MNRFLCLFIFAGLLYSPFLVSASISQGTIDSTYKYAWSDNLGWINFGCDGCGIQVTDDSISGYAWSENYGWINLDPAESGIANTNGTGALSGKAWGENIGWIDFRNVSINSDGQLTGTATADNSLFGTIYFSECGNSCLVQTDWRPRGGNITTSLTAESSVPTTEAPLVQEPAVPTVKNFVLPAEGLEVIINDGATRTAKRAVKLVLVGGSDAVQVELSDNPAFTNSVPEIYETVKSFVFPPGDGVKTVYVRFLNSEGQVSPVVSSAITLYTKFPEIKADNVSDLFGPDEDVILSGTMNASGNIIFRWDDKYGMANVAKAGKWTANLGKMSSGSHTISITGEDNLGNAKKITANINVRERQLLSPAELAPASVGSPFSYAKSFMEKLRKEVNSLVGLLNKREEPLKIVTMVKEKQEVFKGNWNLLSVPVVNYPKTK